MGSGSVVKITGFVRFIGSPTLLKKGIWAVRTERVEPLDEGRGPVLALRIPTLFNRIKVFAWPSSEDFGSPFEFASEASGDWRDAKTPTEKNALLDEYRHYIRVIRGIDGFEDVGASMEEFLNVTGVPLYDIRPENCGRILHGNRRIVCFDLMTPEKGDGSLAPLPRPPWKP